MGWLKSIASSFGKVGATIIGRQDAQEQIHDDRAFNAEQAQMNRDFQREERLATQEFNVDMWNKNNEYNSPSAQLERAKEAGINPNALFAGGYNSATSSPVSSSPMSGSMAQNSSSIASAMLNRNVDGVIGSAAELANLFAQTKKLNSEAELNRYELTWNTKTEAERLQQLKNLTNEQQQRMGIANIDSDIRQKTYQWLAKQNEADLKIKSEQLNNLRNSNYEIIARTQNINADTALKGAQESLVESQVTGQELANETEALSLAFSTITGIPIGASEFQALYMLWQEGKWNDFTAGTQISASTKGGATGGAAAASSIIDGKINNLGQEATKLGKAVFQGGKELFNDGKLLYDKSLPYAKSLVERLMHINPF